MKKILSILLVICMALSVCACSGGGSDDPQKGSDRESYSPDYGKLYYEANGVKFGIMDYADEVMEKLPEPSGSFENESCAVESLRVQFNRKTYAKKNIAVFCFLANIF